MRRCLGRGVPWLALTLPLFEHAVQLEPSRTDALLNLANASLLANQPEQALARVEQALSFDRNLAAACYVAGCAHLPTGSGPYLYAWDGERFRFVTDILGSAPMGLRVSDCVFAGTS